MRIAYADPRFYWAREHSKNPDEPNLPARVDELAITVRAYLQGRADNEREWIELVEACNAAGWTVTQGIRRVRRR